MPSVNSVTVSEVPKMKARAIIYMNLQESQILSEGFLTCLRKLTVQWTALDSEVPTHATQGGGYIVLDATAPLINFIDLRKQTIHKSL